MRTPSLIFSVVVHCGAIGGAVVCGAFASASTRVAAKVEVRASEAWAGELRSPAPQRSAEALLDVDLPVVAESVVVMPDLAADPELDQLDAQLAEPAALVFEPVPPAPSLIATAAWRMRIRPAAVEEPVQPPVDVKSEPPRASAEPPQPASAHVAASPLSDNEPPHYPPSERALGHEGAVVVVVKVDTRGLVIEATLAEASVYPGLNRAALAAARRWRFEPSTVDGVRVADTVRLPFEFRLQAAR